MLHNVNCEPVIKSLAVAVAIVSASAFASDDAKPHNRDKYEQPDYTVLDTDEKYEIREYPPYVVARIRIDAPAQRAPWLAFDPLAGYIFGNNAKVDKIAMTSPVLMEEAASQKIAMTSPVLMNAAETQDDAKGESHWVSFIMPSKYTIDELPVPKDPRVQLVEMPARIVAARRFSGSSAMRYMWEQEEILKKALDKDKIETTGEAAYAIYDEPMTKAEHRRNEVMIPVAYNPDA